MRRGQILGSGVCSSLTGMFLLLVSTTPPVEAVSLNPPRLNGFLHANLLPSNLEFQDFGEYSIIQPGGTAGDSTATFAAYPTPAPSLEGTVSVAPYRYVRTQATLTYDVHIVGPDGIVPVQVGVSGAVLTHPGLGDWSPQPTYPAFIVHATWGIVGVFSEGIEVGPIYEDYENVFDHKVDLHLTANQTYQVTMHARAEASGGDFGSFARAFIDPVFTFGEGVDPAYSFQFSEGIGNTAVPDPGSTLFLLSNGALALALMHGRSRRTKADGSIRI